MESSKEIYFNEKGFTSVGAKKYGFKKGNKLGFKKGYIPWNKGKHFITRDIKGKTYEEIYGNDKAKKLREKRSNENNHNWKGDKAGHHSIHTWVRTRLGTPQKCDFCGTTNAKFFDWANKSGKYERKLDDWLRLCRKCHCLFDLKRKEKDVIFKRFGSKKGNYCL